MKYCTWKETGKSWIFDEYGFYINPYNGREECYMGEELFKVSYREPIKSQIIIRDFDDVYDTIETYQ